MSADGGERVEVKMPNPCDEGVGEMVCGGIASSSLCCGQSRVRQPWLLPGGLSGWCSALWPAA